MRGEPRTAGNKPCSRRRRASGTKEQRGPTGAQTGFLRLHAPDEPPLAVAHGGQRLQDRIAVPAEVRPIGELVDVDYYLPRFLRRLWRAMRRTAIAFAATFAANVDAVRRKRAGMTPAPLVPWRKLSLKQGFRRRG